MGRYERGRIIKEEEGQMDNRRGKVGAGKVE